MSVEWEGMPLQLVPDLSCNTHLTISYFMKLSNRTSARRLCELQDFHGLGGEGVGGCQRLLKKELFACSLGEHRITRLF